MTEENLQESQDIDPLEALQAKADENWSQYLRAVAELENTRKRAQRDVEHAHRFALERFVADLAPVRESLEMGLATAAVGDEAAVKALREGVEMTLKQLDAALERHGVSVLDPTGAAFDPENHEAMQIVSDPDAAPGSVLMVVQKGLSLNGRLLRPARVIVAGSAKDAPQT